MEWSTIGWRSCLNCGSWRSRVSGLCPACEESLFMNGEPGAHISRERGFIVRSLFRWNPGESDLLSRLIRGLKGPAKASSWRYWAKTFLRCHGAEGSRGSLFIPSPSSRGGVDHASLWSSALAEMTSADLRSRDLFMPRQARQKELSRHQRRERLVVNMTGWTPPSGTGIIIGDDVVTTGETARRIYEALGKPSKYEVWAFVDRGRDS